MLIFPELCPAFPGRKHQTLDLQKKMRCKKLARTRIFTRHGERESGGNVPGPQRPPALDALPGGWTVWDACPTSPRNHPPPMRLVSKVSILRMGRYHHRGGKLISTSLVLPPEARTRFDPRTHPSGFGRCRTGRAQVRWSPALLNANQRPVETLYADKGNNTADIPAPAYLQVHT